MAKSRKEQLMMAGEGLKQLRTPYEAHYRELGDNFMPRRSRFAQGRSHKSEAMINKKIINSRPRLALRTAASGMQTGMTSPARPWYRLQTLDLELRKDARVKRHMDQAMRSMRQMMQSTGLYNVLHTLWADLLWCGTDAMILENDMSGLIRPKALVPGEYWIGSNSDDEVDTLYREIEMTLQYIVGKFVYKGVRYGTPDWSVVTSDVKSAWDNGNYGLKKPVSHLIAPRMERDNRSWLPKDKPVMSTYWMTGDSRVDTLLGDLGYDENPIIASRWDADGNNVWGTSPAMDILADAKSLQIQERDKREAVRRMNRPPMNAPIELRNSSYSLMPEAVNFMADPGKGLVPAYQVTPPYQHLLQEVQTTEDRINEGMYANLFLMISQLQRREITAREIDERHEEKLIGLGPVLERQQKEKLSVVVRRYYTASIMTGAVEPLPQELANVPTEIDYISMLAQAQKAIATGGIERLYGFLGNLAATDESVLDLTDNDYAVREYADLLGVSGETLKSEDDVASARKARNEAAQKQVSVDQAAQVAPALKQTADAAKVLADADATGRPVDILQNLGLR